MRHLLLALDAGTSGCKAEVFTPEGRSVARGSCRYGPDAATAGTTLQASALRGAAAAAVREALSGVSTGDVAGLGVSAQLGLASLDESGRPVGELLTWADSRATAQAALIRERIDDAEVYATCGRQASPEWLLPRVLHLRETDPEAWRRSRTHLPIKDYLLYELTGRRLTDPTHASYTLAYDVVERRWAASLLDAFDIDTERLPEVLPAQEIAGEATGELARQLGLPTNLPVVVGGPDGTLGALGAGLVDSGRAIGIVGTTDVFFACSRTPVFDPGRGTVVNCYVVPERWAMGGPMSSTGGCLDWFATRVAGSGPGGAATQDGYPQLDALAEAVPPGSHDLICIPSLVGDRAPLWDPDRRGTFFGISSQHGVGEMARAILEGSAFASRVMVERLESCDVAVREIVLAGGGARSRLWSQIRADVLNRPTVVPEVVEATNLGSAMLLAVALGIHPDLAAAARTMIRPGARFEPQPRHRDRYDALYSVYAELHAALATPTRSLARAAWLHERPPVPGRV